MTERIQAQVLVLLIVGCGMTTALAVLFIVERLPKVVHCQ